MSPKKLFVDTRVSYAAFILFLIGVGVLFIWSLHYFYAPNSDFFLYLTEGHALTKSPFARVVAPPLYSIIVFCLETALPIRSPGFIGGALLNIVLFVLTLYFMWDLSKRWLGAYAYVPVVWMLMSPLSYPVNLQTTNMPLALLFVIMSLDYNDTNPITSYILAALAVFSRIESIVLFAIFIVFDLAKRKRIRAPLILFVCAAIACCSLLGPLLRPNGLDYIHEIVARRAEVPNVLFITNSFFIIPFSAISKFRTTVSFFSEVSFFTAATIMWLTAGAWYCYKRHMYEPFMLLGYISMYSVIHLVFPDAAFRYSYLVLPGIFILLCWPAAITGKKAPQYIRICTVIIVVSLTGLIGSFFYTDGLPYVDRERLIDSEIRLTADWFSGAIHSPSDVYVFEPYVYRYFSNNRYVIYPDTFHAYNWVRDLCAQRNRTYFVLDSRSSADGGYWDYQNGLGFFHLIATSTETRHALSIVHTISMGDHWAKIYTIDTNTWCNSPSIKKLFSQYQ